MLLTVRHYDRESATISAVVDELIAWQPDVLVANGNITGMTSLGPAINAKLVDLTRQRMPRATRVALVGNPGHSLAQS